MTLPTGKLPAALLAGLLGRILHLDERVLIGPRAGRDAAVIDIGGGRVLVATTDPVTFAAEDLGWYAVNVNANDIACMGARPAWFMATALLPPGTTANDTARIFDQLVAACAELNIELVGGHTEITPTVRQPIIIGAMLGEAAREDILDGENIAPGDIVLLSRGIAIEGTAILARERGAMLEGKGVGREVVARAAAMLVDPGISVVDPAQALCAIVRPRLLHDPTEGGVATALAEMAAAAGSRLVIDVTSVPVYPETRVICGALGLDPLGLLASGALLAIVSREDHGRLTSIRNALDDWTVIGAVEPGQPGVILGTEDSGSPLPAFERDELARFFDEAEEAHAE